MDELVKVVTQKTGLPEAQARQAVSAVLDFLKQKLPAPIAGQIDGVLSSGGAGGLGGIADQLGDALKGATKG